LRPPARGGELAAELGHHGRPRPARHRLRLDLSRRAAALARPRLAWIGPRPGDRYPCDLVESSPTRCGPTAECSLTEPTRRTPVAPGTCGSRSPRGLARPTPSPLGGRAHRLASPVRRHGEVSEAPPVVGGSRRPGRGGGRTSECGLVPPGCGRRTPSREPSRCRVKSECGRPRLPDRYDAPSDPETRPEPSSLFMRMRP